MGLSSEFTLRSRFKPKGDQQKAIPEIVSGLEEGKDSQVLLGVTGSGKTFTIANIIERVNRPALILAHNKTLAAQLYQEFKDFFPDNAVEYFVSYYDYYQPEAYLARTDTYIEKDLSINDEINRMRLSATRSLIERRDVIIISSVSCIYGLGGKKNYEAMVLPLQVGSSLSRDDFLLQLVMMHYTRSDIDFCPGNFRVRGDVIELFPTYEDKICYRIQFGFDEVEKITLIDPLTGRLVEKKNKIKIFPGSHHVVPQQKREEALISIGEELKERIKYFKEKKLYAEEQRIAQRTGYDIEMIKEVGFCKGIENYSLHFDERNVGQPPACLMDYFPDDYLLFVDESHQTVPQIRAMIHGDRSRKESLVNFGFRLPSAYDNRPLSFDEWYEKKGQTVYVSATPGEWEIKESSCEVVRQVIRPTGLLDPTIEVRKAKHQLDDCISEISIESKKGRRIFVTCLTKKMSEEITTYLVEMGIKAKYLHSEVKTLDRMRIINDLKVGKFDVLIGINLLREGLDVPEVSLVMILDADREGFLRSETSLTQTCGRAARNIYGRVILYADIMTNSIKRCIDETEKRRKIQESYNQENNITPSPIISSKSKFLFEQKVNPSTIEKIDPKSIEKKIKSLEKAMHKYADSYDFEKAASLRDEIKEYKNLLLIE